MGKKTDAFIKKLTDQTDVCNATSVNLLKIIQVWPALDAEWDKWEHEMVLLSNWEDHPYGKKRAAVWTKGRELAARLRQEANALSDINSEFNQYILKKEKSKNPFKSKKSVPAAKAAIKAFFNSAQKLNDLASSGLSTFR